PHTELLASTLCLGTGSLGSTVMESDSFRLLDAFLHLGGNFIDTAKIYADWIPGERSASEKMIGKWLKRANSRHNVIMGTKGAHPPLENLHQPRLSPIEITADLNASLQHLQTDYIDLYWLHRDDPNRPVEDIMETLNIAEKAGKVRYFGCSNWTVPRIEAANAYAAKQGFRGFAATQNMWSLAVPNKDAIEDKTLVMMEDRDRAFHEKSGMAAIPYSSQANGFFSGRYRKGEPLSAANSAKHVEGYYYNDENFARLERLERVANQQNLTRTQVALGYLLSQPFPVFPIVGCYNITQLQDSCTSGNVNLDLKVLRYLENGNQQ
ncbi:MAG TPA: aldo/keto reductase, partial [Bacilli bacterium]